MRALRWTFALAGLAATLAAAPLMAQHPDFSGTWTFDPLTSSSSPMMPTAATYIIVQHGDTLTMDRSTSTSQGDSHSHMVQGIDGQPWKNVVAMGGDSVSLTSTATWAHDTVMAHVSGSVQGTDFTENEQMIMAPDGKSFSYIRALSFGGQDIPPMTMVFIKKS